MERVQRKKLFKIFKIYLLVQEIQNINLEDYYQVKNWLNNFYLMMKDKYYKVGKNIISLLIS